MAISQETIENIKLSSDIVSVIREYVPSLKRAGRNWTACCPFHNEKTPSFVVSPEKGIFNCFGCHAAGDVFKFISLADNVSWIDAVRKLAQRASIEIRETKEEIIKSSQKMKLFDILESAAVFYNRCLLESPQAKFARQYLQKRGVNTETVKKFKLGFAPKGSLLQAISKKHIAVDDIIKAGIITKTESGSLFEYMSDRLVFPIFDASGKVLAFGGRTLSEQQPKYLNTPETLIYSKSSNLYGLYQTLPSLRKERKIIVLEGYMDVVIPWQFEISGAVACLGTSFTKNHAKLISRYADKVTLLFDGDDAGRSAAQRAFEILIEDSIECRASELPEGIDADEYLNENGKEKFLSLLDSTAKSAIDFMIERILSQTGKNTPESKAKAASILLDFVLRNPNEIVQGEWLNNISQKINISHEALLMEFKKKRASKFKIAARGAQPDEQKASVKKQKLVFSLEEILLSLILVDRDLIEKIADSDFEDERCKKVYYSAVKGIKDDEILTSLSEQDAAWFSDLLFRDLSYRNADNIHSKQSKEQDSEEESVKNNAKDKAFIRETFDAVLKDLQLRRLEKRRQTLKEAVADITVKKRAYDENIIKEYNDLNTQLKGSRR
ncbi:MAG: DNA primase [Endomicrobium sp.]|jgi:DNA primase|nr:DNA primase [Endomicrobium sp.]